MHLLSEINDLQARLRGMREKRNRQQGPPPVGYTAKRNELIEELNQKLSHYRSLKEKIRKRHQQRSFIEERLKVGQWTYDPSDVYSLLMAAWSVLNSFAEHGYPLNKEEQGLMNVMQRYYQSKLVNDVVNGAVT